MHYGAVDTCTCPATVKCDYVPALLEKKYLKTIYNCHLCAGTLDGGDIDGDGELTVLDIDHIIA